MTRKDVFNIIEVKDKKPIWHKVGAAFVNKDGSLNVILNSLPIDGKLHIRDHVERDNNNQQPNY